MSEAPYLEDFKAFRGIVALQKVPFACELSSLFYARSLASRLVPFRLPPLEFHVQCHFACPMLTHSPRIATAMAIGIDWQSFAEVMELLRCVLSSWSSFAILKGVLHRDT